jgi:S1-C subfamily serine protease
MKRTLGTALLAVLLVASAVAAAEEKKQKAQEPKSQRQNVVDYLQDISVTFSSKYGEGSGVAVVREDRTFILTAGHCVDDLRKTRKVIDPRTGTERTVVEFDDAKIIKVLVEGGRKVGQIEMDAKVLAYSGADHGDDLAALRVWKKGFLKTSARFWTKDSLPPIGMRLYHVGSLLGQQGANSMTDGIVSQHGRLYQNKTYLQTTCPAFPGSSGGGVFSEDGEYIATLVRGAGETFNLCVPPDRIRKFCKRAKIEWLLDPDLPVPSDNELDKLKPDVISAEFEKTSLGEKAIKDWFHRYEPTPADKPSKKPVDVSVLWDDLRTP